MINLRSFDLNLLLALKALLEEKNVSRAAEKLYLSQPAMSHVLSRLRSQLDDPILVKSASGMVPTARALALLEPTVAVLREIERIVESSPKFDPATSRRRFVIATSDYVVFAVLPKLAESIMRIAPNIEVHIRQPIVGPPHIALEKENIDVAIGFDAIFGATPHICSDALMGESMVCLTRQCNATVPGNEITLEQFLECKHMLISWREAGTGLIDDSLAKLGLRRDVSFILPNFLTTPWILEKTDLLLCLPWRMADKFVQLAPLKILPIPIDLPRYELRMLWHPRYEKDRAHMWLRERLRTICRRNTANNAKANGGAKRLIH
ncbi:LysR family transcriptional regulator [Methylocystis sp.]|uniref:LysR family transcriptional regulator n=1 Tax=Methylocystis sp. TaxID=1911079 RepID=UPI003D0FE020